MLPPPAAAKINDHAEADSNMEDGGPLEGALGRGTARARSVGQPIVRGIRPFWRPLVSVPATARRAAGSNGCKAGNSGLLAGDLGNTQSPLAYLMLNVGSRRNLKNGRE